MLKDVKKIFFLGIKGAAMANLAVYFKKMGKTVAGTDTDDVFITDEILAENNIKSDVGFDEKNLDENVDLVVYSAAHNGVRNPIIQTALKRKIDVITQADLIGEIMRDFGWSIAVSGCHGKTTTTSLLAYALDNLGARPSYLVGVPYFTGHPGVNYQGDKYFVVEADEYGINPPLDKTPKFHKLDPDYIVATNIDFDHPDVYKNVAETERAFLKFFKRALGKRARQPFVFSADDGNLMKAAKSLPEDSYVTCGYAKTSDYRIVDVNMTEDYSDFDLLERETGKKIGGFRVSIPGRMNIVNASQVIVMLMKLGYGTKDIAKAISGFEGSERRFQKIYRSEKFALYDDYAHHPSEIKTTILAAKDKFPGKRVVVIFQPHTFSRTAYLLNDFARSLSAADKVLLLPIFPSAREDASAFKISSADIAKKASNDRISAFASKEELLLELKNSTLPGDIIFMMGAGDVYKMKDEIMEIMLAQKSLPKIEKNKDLYPFLTLKTHVTAEFFVDAKTRDDLIEAKNYSLERGLPFFILGGGSNLAIVKGKISGLVVRNSYKDLKVLSVDDEKATIMVSSGYPVALLVAQTISRGYDGFVYHQGLPGTVGGAVYMNSKWTKPPVYFGDDLEYAYLLDKNGKVKKVGREYFDFAYDYSKLQETKEIVLEAVFVLKKEDPEKLREKAAWALDYRKKTQPFGIASSGCFFKNISVKDKERLGLPTTSAGYLIDKSGLKGFSLGAFYVSPIHANFIVNKKEGKRSDLVKLMGLIKRKVKDKFGIQLEEEVIVI